MSKIKSHVDMSLVPSIVDAMQWCWRKAEYIKFLTGYAFYEFCEIYTTYSQLDTYEDTYQYTITKSIRISTSLMK